MELRGTPGHVEPGPSPPGEPGRPSLRRTVVVAVVLGIVTGLPLALIYINDRRAAAEDYWRSRLQVSARVRAEQASQWITERRRDAETVSRSLAGVFGAMQASQTPEAARRAGSGTAQSVLNGLARTYGYEGALLDGRLVPVARTPGAQDLEIRAQESVRAAVRERAMQVTLLPGPVADARLLIAAPLLPPDSGVVGVLLLQAPLFAELVDQLVEETAPTRTGDVVLVARWDDSVELVSLREFASESAVFRRGAGELPIGPRLALEGVETFTEYVDYRDVPVLGGTAHIDAAGWGLVRKIDKAEAYADLERTQRLVGISFVFLLLTFGTGGLAWRQYHHGTEQRHREASRERSYRLLQAVTESTGDAVFIKDRDGRYLMMNAQGTALLGRGVSEVVGKTDSDLFPPDAEERIRRQDAEIIATGKPMTYTDSLEVGGATRSYLFTKGPYRDERGQIGGVVGIARDVTDHRKMELQFYQAQKMEAIGRLAGGVAHDFNNCLTVILGLCDIELRELSQDDPRRSDLEEIRAAGERAATLTRQLLAFSRLQVLQMQPLNLNEVVRGLEKMLRRLIGEDIEIRLQLDEPLANVLADPAQMEQVLVNLAVNARDAMPRGGVLTVATAEQELRHPLTVDSTAIPPGTWVTLAVRDTGVGIKAGDRLRVFEPFFTTKEKGKGTGLGLSTVYGIVKQSGGYISVESEPGRGATFQMYFPPTVKPAAPLARRSGEFTLDAGHETVLVAEDEAPVLDVVRRTLEGAGYNVLAVDSAERALELLRARTASVDLLVTDVIMPKVSGPELAIRAAGEVPGLRVLFLSGYAADEVEKLGVAWEKVPFLQKPFTPAQLLEKVRAVLAATADGT